MYVSGIDTYLNWLYIPIFAFRQTDREWIKGMPYSLPGFQQPSGTVFTCRHQFLPVRLITATAITAFLLSIPRLTTGVVTYVFHTRYGCIPCGLSILLSPPRRAGRKGVGCSHRQCYRLFNACSTGPTHQTCLTAYRRVGGLEKHPQSA